MQRLGSGIPVLVDLEARLRIMDRYEGYVQVLTLANPPLEVVGGPAVTPDLARLANDAMAAIVERHPHRFPAFVASLPMNNPDAALAEIDRSIGDLGATGVQIFTNVAGRPLDDPEYQPLFARMAEHRLPTGCIRPARPAWPTTRANRARSSTCGGRSAGPTRRPSRWADWCSPAFSTDSPSW